MIFKWKILDISADGELITHAKYYVSATDEENTVETEGNWWFSDKILKKPFKDVTEQDIVSWIEQETTQNDVNIIKSRLEEQLNSLNTKKAILPWMPQVFTPNL